MLMLDLFSGNGGASAAMVDRGWEVIRVDIESRHKPTIVADIRAWSWDGAQPDLIWASPPCAEFSRDFLPWIQTDSKPDLQIMFACKRILEETEPRFWVVENVKGAIRWFTPWFGKYREAINPFFLWGFFPPIREISKRNWKKKESRSSAAIDARARIPYEISEALAIAIEKQPVLL